MIATSDEETAAIQSVPRHAIFAEVGHGVSVGVDHHAHAQALAPQERTPASGIMDRSVTTYQSPETCLLSRDTHAERSSRSGIKNARRTCELYGSRTRIRGCRSSTRRAMTSAPRAIV